MKNSYFCLMFAFIVWSQSLFGYKTKDDKHVFEKASQIKLIALDVDGVLTDGEIAYTSHGDEIKAFNVKDGFGLILASRNGFITAIITSRESPMVERRGKELLVHKIYQNAKDKTKAIQELATQHKLSLHEICYMGDDLPDLPVLKMVGLACCPADAVPEVKKECGWIASHRGGKGAVRELTDFLIASKQHKEVKK